MAKPSAPTKKPGEKPAKPIIEQPAMFDVPLGAGARPRAKEWDECDWPIARFRVLDALSRKIPQTLEGKNGRPAPRKNGKPITVSVSVRHSLEKLETMADVTEAEALEALEYFTRLHLVRYHRSRSRSNGDPVDAPAEYQITAAGTREHARVKPIIYARELAQ